jgi:chromosome segregation protein
MRLTRLHIAGFKSFPDRAELGFDDGVTAIVGPNGCGKSNVVDAITWVLGEQSVKSLRGERMEDVIFNGSDARKPTASAEVRLKLSQVARRAMTAATASVPIDALDEDPIITRDVEIGRRLYRSGESEYLIDGEVCRLRDVHDLLMDSGLGVKAYAVIEQGKIGQILSSRPAERRTLIEEAAGVTKYKTRRRAAELKLEAAQHNLTRVDDIIFEVEKQRGALKRQAARARRYRRLREELRKWEQVQFARRYETLARDVEAAEGRLADARSRAAAAAAHVAELEAGLEAIRLRLTEGEAGATSAREQAHARALEIGRHQQQVAFDRQQIDELARQAGVFAEEVRLLQDRLSPAAEALRARREAAVGARAALDASRADVAAREADYSAAVAAVQAIEQESDAVRATVLASFTTLSALCQARDHAAAIRDRVAAELERLGVEERELAAEVDRVRTQQAALTRSLEDSRTALSGRMAERREAERAQAARRTDHERVSELLSAAERDVAARDARLRALEEIEASRATFGEAARFLLSATPAPVPHHGAVADHLDVDRTYERAVDALIGDRLQYVLVDHADDVAPALALVAERNAGRCGFLVLEAGAASPDATPPLVVPPGARALSSVVRAVGRHAQVVARVIDRALVCDSFEAARALSARVSVPVAARTGEVFRSSWMVEGGSRQDARGILETRAATLALREELDAARADLARMRAETSELARAIDQADRTLSSHRADEHEREKAIVALEGQLTRAADDRLRAERRLDLVAAERRRADEEQTTAEARREEAAAAIAVHEARQHDAEASLGAVSSRLQGSREETEHRLRRVTESRTEEATLVERAAALATEVARLEEASRELDERLDTRRADIRRTEDRRAELAASIARTERALDAAVEALRHLEAEVRAVDERVVALRSEFGEREHGIRSARHAFDALRSEVSSLEVSQARAASDLAHLEAACLEAVGASLDDVVALVARLEEAGELVPPVQRAAATLEDEEEPDADEGGSPGSAEPAVREEPAPAGEPGPEGVIALLRTRIERLGPVNMMAIEQFDELESRHTFLTTQRRDLIESIAQTGEAIRKIDKTTRERFAEAFESINRNFEGTFTTLFGGGRAGLVLIDQENDTESGIDIIAQPPGKRLQNVQLLSGGEKALTAMALMFAIFKYRPSPFCLLDEIDAPLDDANIGRFVEMLQGMQTETQFILITHNRKTMEIADRLYGVTMEEPGVSKLISVQLN